jgi:hypothetical protein
VRGVYLNLPFIRDESTTLHISQGFGCHLQKHKYKKKNSESINSSKLAAFTFLYLHAVFILVSDQMI